MKVNVPKIAPKKSHTKKIHKLLRIDILSIFIIKLLNIILVSIAAKI